MRILLVEDDAALSDVLKRVLREASYAVDLAEDGLEAEWMASEDPYDLMVLDLSLPRQSGLDTLKALRRMGESLPVLILTAKDATEDRVAGLDAGADDYLCKPFSIQELLARIRALLRRKPELQSNVLVCGSLAMDLARKTVALDGQECDLTVKEFALLEYFLRNAGQVLSRVQLSEHVWDAGFEPNSNVVDVYVGYLRTKFKERVGAALIRTVRGHGYILEEGVLVSSTLGDGHVV